jgi:hypothetical protein
MVSDSFFLYSRTASSGASTRDQLLRKLHLAKKRLNSTPQPYCEIDCPWLCLCRISIPPGCILNDLIDTSLWQEKNIDSSGK